jgi:hypothetical protein
LRCVADMLHTEPKNQTQTHENLHIVTSGVR